MINGVSTLSRFSTSSSDTTAGEIRVPICEPAKPRTAFEMRVAGSRMRGTVYVVKF